MKFTLLARGGSFDLTDRYRERTQDPRTTGRINIDVL